MRKAHPEWVSLLAKKYNTVNDGSINTIIASYKNGGDNFLNDWYYTFHQHYSNAEGDTWIDGFKSWFNDATTVLSGSTAIANTVNNSINPENQANQKLTQSEQYEKNEKIIWWFFIIISLLMLSSLLIITFSKRRS